MYYITLNLLYFRKVPCWWNSLIFRCKKPSKNMPSKASLPSALVDPIDPSIAPQSIDSGERQSSSRSKISTNSSTNNNENPFFKSFKSFRRKRKSDQKDLNGVWHNIQVMEDRTLFWMNLKLYKPFKRDLLKSNSKTYKSFRSICSTFRNWKQYLE